MTSPPKNSGRNGIFNRLYYFIHFFQFHTNICRKEIVLPNFRFTSCHRHRRSHYELCNVHAFLRRDVSSTHTPWHHAMSHKIPISITLINNYNGQLCIWHDWAAISKCVTSTFILESTVWDDIYIAAANTLEQAARPQIVAREPFWVPSKRHT